MSTSSISEIQRLLSIFQTLIIQINQRIDTNNQAPQLSHKKFFSTVTRLDSLIQNHSTRLQTNEVNTNRDITHCSSQTEAVVAANRLAFSSIDSLQSTVASQTNQTNDLKAVYEAQGLQLRSEI